MGLAILGGMRWKSAMVAVGGLAVILVSGTGCQNALYTENKQLREQNRELQAKNDQLMALVHDQGTPMTPPDVAKPEKVKPEKLSTGNATPAAAPMPPMASFDSTPASTAGASVAGPGDLGGEVTVDAVAGTTTVNFLGDALFLSGQATLVQSAKENLNKLAVALKKQYAGKQVKVQGHSDSDPIKHSTWKDNQQLSEVRAKAVRDYLVTKGVPAGLITSEGFGDTKPKSPTDKAKNRRVEIVVLTK